MKIFVTVIIPNYNHSQFLLSRIETILVQKFANYEIIILDDCSTDNSKQIIESYRDNARISHIEYNEKNIGSPFKQWQKGIELAKGDWIWIAESDDYCSSEFLSKLTKYLDDETAFVYCNSHIVDKDDNITCNTNKWITDLSETKWMENYEQDGKESFTQFHRYKNIVSNTSSVIFRKELVKKNDIFPSDYRICGDWLFFAQLSLLGKVKYVNEPLNYWRQHPSTTRNAHNLGYERLRMIENIKIIKYFNRKSISLGHTSEWKKYAWIIDWWISRYSYKNLFNSKYVFIPLPWRLNLMFYDKLLKRTVKEFINSIKKKLQK